MAVPTPLTTTFTPAASCLSEIHWGTASPWFQLGPGTQCIPSGPNPSVSSFYSPGLYCPSGYTVACSTEVTNGAATETRATCCPEPTALGSLSSAAFACQVNTLFFATSYGCALALGTLASNSLTVVATNGSTFQSTFSVGDLDAVNAFSVQIRWQESDLVTTTSDSASSTSTSVASGSATATTITSAASGATSGAPTSASTTVPSAASTGGLSTGAKIAIGVVVPVVVILAVVAGFFIWRRRKHNRTAIKVEKTEPTHELPAGVNTYQDTKPPPQMPSELDGAPMYEAGSDSKPAVMKG